MAYGVVALTWIALCVTAGWLAARWTLRDMERRLHQPGLTEAMRYQREKLETLPPPEGR